MVDAYELERIILRELKKVNDKGEIREDYPNAIKRVPGLAHKLDTAIDSLSNKLMVRLAIVAGKYRSEVRKAHK